jgi:hypothetical protein
VSPTNLDLEPPRSRALRTPSVSSPLLCRGQRAEVVSHGLLAEVLGPAERRGPEPCVADAGVGAELNEQPHPVAHVMRDRPLELSLDQLGRGVGPHPEARPPRPAAAAPVAEQQRKVAVVAAELPVVQRLPVIGICPGRQQRPGQREAVQVPRLVTAAACTDVLVISGCSASSRAARCQRDGESSPP